MNTKSLIPTILLLILALIFGCIVDTREAKRGHEVENEVYGFLVDAEGQPVVGARIVANSAENDSGLGDSVWTDNQGRYVLDSLPPGEYDLIGSYQPENWVVFIPDISIEPGVKGQNLGIDTLRTPGTLQGRLMVGNAGKPNVLVVVQGVSKIDISDDSGYFSVSGIPEGRYSVRYSAPGFLINPDSAISILSGKVTVLRDKALEYDPTLNPPEPINLKAVFDTLKQRVTLSWESVPVSDLDGFMVFRDDADSPSSEELKGTYTPRSPYIDSSLGDIGTLGGRFAYRLKSRDSRLNLSLSFSDPVYITVAPRTLVTTTVGINATGLRNGRGTPGDTVRFVASFMNPTRGHQSITWIRESDSTILKSLPVKGPNGNDTLTWILGPIRTDTIIARLKDDGGQEWDVRFPLDVIEDRPIAEAGQDTVVSIGDSLFLKGSGSDDYGDIIHTEWSIGSAPFIPSNDGLAMMVAPTSPGPVTCKFRVTDDDGFTHTDSLTVIVVLDPPTVTVRNDTTVSINDSLRLQGIGTDGYGKVVRYEWDLGAIGEFIESTSDTSVTAPSISGNWLCVLRVTDDDGLFAVDTIRISVLADPPSADAGPDSTVSIGDTLILRGWGEDTFGEIVQWEWNLPNSGGAKVTGKNAQLLAPLIPDSAFQVVLKVTDDDGQIGTDTARFNVILDPPVADLKIHPEAVLPNSEVQLSGRNSSDSFGRIVKWEWDIGGSGNFTEGKSDTVFRVPSNPKNPILISLRITDDDGNQTVTTDSVLLHTTRGINWYALSSDPQITGFGTNLVSLPPTLWYYGSGKQGTSESGKTVVSSTDDVSSWTSPQTTPVVGEIAVLNNTLWLLGPNTSKTFQSWFYNGSSWVLGSDSTPISSRNSFKMIEFQGKLWLFGGRSNLVDNMGNSLGLLNDIWKSADGINWQEVSSEAPFLAQELFGLTVFKDKIWRIGRDGAWSSFDGANWEKAESQGFPGLGIASALTFDGNLWAMGEADGGEWAIWTSPNGRAWNKVQTGPSFPGRWSFLKTVWNGKLWVIAGERIWYSE